MGVIKLNFDPAGNVEVPTLVLSYRSGKRIGELIHPQGFVFSDEFESPAQLTFSVYKDTCAFWDELDNFKLLWVPEWDKWFEVVVEMKENINLMKYVTATHLVEAELSQLMLYEVEINTEDDINREDYDASLNQVFYDPEHPEASLMHRVTSLAPNLKIGCASEYLASTPNDLEFSFDDKSMLDALQEIAEQVQCHFEYSTSTNPDGTIQRFVVAYDMLDYCTVCHERGDFGGLLAVCPENSRHKVVPGYGENSNVLLNIDNLLDEIDYTTDTDSVKNCFRLDTGDDMMNTAVRDLIPSGSQYLYYWDDKVKKDMSDELRVRLEEYTKIETDISTKRSIDIFGTDDVYQNEYLPIINKYNEILRYDTDIDPFMVIPRLITGYSNFGECYYNLYGLAELIETTLMPNSGGLGDTTAKLQFQNIITVMSNKFIAVKDKSHLTEGNVDNALERMLKSIVDNRYTAKIEVATGQFTLNGDGITGTWTGKFTVTDASATDDMLNHDTDGTYIYTGSATFNVNCEYADYLKIQIDYQFKKADNTDYSVTALLKTEDEAAFKKNLNKYSLTELKSIATVCEGILGVLGELGAGDNRDEAVASVYRQFYEPYYQKSVWIADEINVRNADLEVVKNLLENVRTVQDEIADELNLEKFLGEKLMSELNSFMRQQTYSNTHYSVLDTDSYEDIFTKAKEFIKAAQIDLKKSASHQHTISVSSKNIFTIKEFEPLRQRMSIGNWIRIVTDDKDYNLRLLSYQFDFNNFTTTDITFSDVVEIGGIVSDLKSVIGSAKSMSSTFSYVERQASKASNMAKTVNNWTTDGLDATLVNIVNTASGQDQVWDENGILLRKQDDYSDGYDARQMRLLNSSIVFTDDNWKTLKTAVGRTYYIDPDNNEVTEMYGVNADVVVGRLILGENLGIYNKTGSLSFNEDGLVVKNPSKDVTFSVDPSTGNVLVKGTIVSGDLTATGGKIGDFIIDADKLIVSGTGLSGKSSNYAFWAGETNGKNGASDSDAKFKVGHNGGLVATDATITGVINATGGKIGGTSTGTGWVIGANSIYNSPSADKSVVLGNGTNANGDVLVIVNNANTGSPTYPFWLHADGSMSASKATITGIINANVLNVSDSIQMRNGSGNYVQSFLFDTTTFDTNKYVGLPSGSYQTLSIGKNHEMTYLGGLTNKVIIESKSGGIYNSINGESKNQKSVLRWTTSNDGDSWDVFSGAIAANVSDNSANVYISYPTGRITRRQSSSSIRYKNIIRELNSDDIQRFYDLPTYSFKYKEGYLSRQSFRYDKPLVGFIAEEVEVLDPTINDHNEDGSVEVWNHSFMIPYMFEMIKDCHKQILELQEENKQLKLKVGD